MTPALRRLRLGELLAGPSGLLLGVAMFLPWYRFAAGDLDAWSAFTVIELLIAPAALAGPALTWAALTRTSPALPVALAVCTAVLGLLATVSVGVRLVFPPGGAHQTRAGAWVGLAAAALLTAAAWHSLSDERPARGVPVGLSS